MIESSITYDEIRRLGAANAPYRLLFVFCLVTFTFHITQLRFINGFLTVVLYKPFTANGY